MDDSHEWNEMNDTDESYTSESDYNIHPETNPSLGDPSTAYDDKMNPESEINDPVIEMRIEDLNIPTDIDEVLATDGEPSRYAELYGDPKLDAERWHQQTYPDTCAVVSQEFILESYLERDFSEEELALEAISKGYYIPGIGTFPDYVGNLLEDYGVEVERSDGNTIEDIEAKLSNNQKIIVGIDANEIWAPSGEEQLKDLLYMPEANHAVMVTGYDDSSQKVYLNDPGHPNGAGVEVNLKDFQNAWNDSCNFMVSTVNAPPNISV